MAYYPSLHECVYAVFDPYLHNPYSNHNYVDSYYALGATLHRPARRAVL